MTGLLQIFTFRHRAFFFVWLVIATAFCFLVTTRLGWRFAGVFGLLGVVYPLYVAFHALSLRAELRLRGYEWITFGNAYALAARHWHRAWRLPPHDEAAATPGYSDTVQGIERFILQAHDLPDAYARTPELERLWKETGALPPAAPVTGAMYWSTSIPLFLLTVLGVNLLCFLFYSLTSWTMGWVFFLNFPVAWGYWLILAWALRNHLERLGYGRWSFRDRVRLAYRCQLLCRRIPGAGDLQKALGTADPITHLALARALMTIGWLEGKAGRTIR